MDPVPELIQFQIAEVPGIEPGFYNLHFFKSVHSVGIIYKM
jgi:hypothetical protein